MKIILTTILFLVFAAADYPQTPNVLVVRAKAGDTLAKLAERYGADPAEVAEYNGLLPNSILGAGREIRIPKKASPELLSSVKKEPCFSDQEIDLTTNKLSSNYHGNELGRIIEVLKERVFARAVTLQKDEFETTTQFKEREKQFLEKQKRENDMPLAGNLFTNSLFVFEAATKFSYDADKEEMQVTFDLATPFGSYDLGDCDQITISKREFRRELSFGGLSDLGYNEKVWSAKFPIKLDVARKLKPNLRFVAIVKLIETKGSYWTLNVEVQQFWIYDVTTGSVYLKQNVRLDQFRPASVRDPKKHVILLAEGRDDEAIALARSELSNDPWCGECYLTIGKVSSRRGDIEAAIAQLKTAVFWDPRLIDAHISLGTIYLAKGDCTQAKNYAASAIEIDSSSSDAKSLQRLAATCVR